MVVHAQRRDDVLISRGVGSEMVQGKCDGDMAELKYIVTVEQIANIVRYCIQMTLQGGSNNLRKDWIPNVEEAIGLNGTRTTMMDKISLEEYSDNK